MSAGVLRKAAALMRERAEAATSYPWESDGPDPKRYRHFDGMVSAIGFPDDFDPLICQAHDNSDAQHIASWHPAVALALADWLDEQAITWDYNERAWTAGAADPRNGWEERGLTVEGNLAHFHRHALAIARAYLGEDA